MKLIAFIPCEGGPWSIPLQSDGFEFAWEDGYVYIVHYTLENKFKPAAVLFDNNMLFDNIIAKGMGLVSLTPFQFGEYPKGLNELARKKVSQVQDKNLSQHHTED